MKPIRIICRPSKLSMLQAELVKEKIKHLFPAMTIDIIGKQSRGDKELNVALSALDGTDFFTEEIFACLQNNEAEIAVHSLKDMSAQHFFSHNAFAIVDREDQHDIAIFNKDIIDKIKVGKKIQIGTCSPRREQMAIGFLQKALPNFGAEINIEAVSLRGNIENRVLQLHENKYDGIILATAGLNRLLKAATSSVLDQDTSLSITELLNDKALMLLPLIECVPAPCQGAIVAEANPLNQKMVAILDAINNQSQFEQAYQEKKYAFTYGTGCLQKFGVTSINVKGNNYFYAAGEDQHGQVFHNWYGLPAPTSHPIKLFTSTNYMKDFFKYTWIKELPAITESNVFVANYKALEQTQAIHCLQNKVVWASGTKTWFELAKKGIWVSGCADAMGFNSMHKIWDMPLFSILKNDICILTHKEAAKRWQKKGGKSVFTYSLEAKDSELLKAEIQQATHLFWTSFSQFEYYGKYAKKDATHICVGGETSSYLQSAGIHPIIFPTIKSFEQWSKLSTPQHKEG